MARLLLRHSDGVREHADVVRAQPVLPGHDDAGHAGQDHPDLGRLQEGELVSW